MNRVSELVRSAPGVRIEVRGLPARTAAHLRGAAQVTAALATLPARVAHVRVIFSDENGAKGGPDVRCGITVSLRGRGLLHAREQAATPRQALAGALAKLERRLLRVEEADRDGRRHPKKYFAAARLRANSGLAMAERRGRGWRGTAGS